MFQRTDPKLKANEMSLLPEFSGRRGRRPLREETEQAKSLFESLEYPIERFWPKWMSRASFPEQNDELLRALSAVGVAISESMRRGVLPLALIMLLGRHGWCWGASDAFTLDFRSGRIVSRMAGCTSPCGCKRFRRR